MRKFDTAAVILILAGLSLCPPAISQSPEGIPAFPQAEGFGARSVGGRGGKVVYVENLEDGGPGSFRAAIGDSVPRTIIFRVSGTIELKRELYLRSSYVTIAGQTAPGDGICLKNYPLQIVNCHDVIVRDIRVRPGTGSGKPVDGIEIRRSKNVILDHCSAGWSIDEILNTWHDNENITVQWSIFSEALNNSIHPKGKHGYGASIGGIRASYHHNLFASNVARNPSIGGNNFSRTEWLDFRNNVVFNWEHRSCDGKPRTMDFAGNYYKPGPATLEAVRRRLVRIDNSEKYGYSSLWYIDDNVIEGYPALSGSGNWNGAVDYEAGASMEKNRQYTPYDNAHYRTREASATYNAVLEDAGATVPRRDVVDARVVEDTRTGITHIGNGIIDRVEQAGGWPELRTYAVPLDTDEDGMPDEWETARDLDQNDPGDRNRVEKGEVYTNLERYLNALASNQPYLLPPVNLDAVPDDEGHAGLNWTDISTDETGFIVERKEDNEGSYRTLDTVPANVTAYTDTAVIRSAKITYRVYAYNHDLNSIPSEPVAITGNAVNRVMIEPGHRVDGKMDEIPDGTAANREVTYLGCPNEPENRQSHKTD